MSRGIVLLDSQGLSKLLDDDPHVVRLVRKAQAKDHLVGLSNLTLIEAWHHRMPLKQLHYEASKLKVLPVSTEITWKAIDLLRDAGLHGHKYAIDAVVAATALEHPAPRIVVTSDVDDMYKLCGDRIEAVPV
ncbi:PIN domain-containing protein [Streptomyces sp. TRM64462]|uniref:type II toxin-antitoxin system VapC family toxin n=1 Tax=Streptomyces sp. TRM64462 TaxID=2741726 RepID=UPI001C3096CC|nr:PIN domain-containing protein [Streptomyces sp. TRM64462]